MCAPGMSPQGGTGWASNAVTWVLSRNGFGRQSGYVHNVMVIRSYACAGPYMYDLTTSIITHHSSIGRKSQSCFGWQTLERFIPNVHLPNAALPNAAPCPQAQGKPTDHRSRPRLPGHSSFWGLLPRTPRSGRPVSQLTQAHNPRPPPVRLRTRHGNASSWELDHCLHYGGPSLNTRQATRGNR